MNQPAIIDLHDPTALDTVTTPRKMLLLVLLVAAKDGASEVRFEPVSPGEVIDLGFPLPPWSESDTLWTVPAREEWDGCRLRYRSGGVLQDMVPSPCSVQVVRNEVVSLAGLGPVRRWLRRVLAWLGRVRGDSTIPLRLLVGGKPLDILVAAPWVGEALVLHLLEPRTAAEEAARFLEAFLERWRACQEIENASPG